MIAITPATYQYYILFFFPRCWSDLSQLPLEKTNQVHSVSVRHNPPTLYLFGSQLIASETRSRDFDLFIHTLYTYISLHLLYISTKAYSFYSSSTEKGSKFV
ncbi:hypothetical protein WN55_03374 [Dufourea novaeangliae]|uniref:Uncharacterized protein n=1 Tax=Dufourea novaeangliae TaxID=178035 RepID=A0A154PL68_DUFNO|nr:hypothetical protein WN55_03374 [Dufourea novaeangliae]